MSPCEECKHYGSVKKDDELYNCVLCGRPHCARHTVWIPAHEVETRDAKAEEARSHIKGKPIRGWYPFCRTTFHTPRGVSIRVGADRKNGSIVEPILFDDRPKSLKSFRRWKVGVVEDGVEHRWPPEQYELPCSLTGLITIVAKMYEQDVEGTISSKQIYSQVITSSYARNEVFYPPTHHEFFSQFGTNMQLMEVLEFICSRCMTAICLNRQAPFFDSKIFKRVLRTPWKIAPR